MNENLQDSLKSMSTEQLLEIWTQRDHDDGSADTFGFVLDLLLLRGVEIPQPARTKSRKKSGSPSFSLPSKSNSSLRGSSFGKTEIRFPKGGFMQHGRFEFKDQDDLLDYLTNTFQLPSKEGSRWRISRKGKYQRVDEKDNPIFTFGDPIVDLITNRHGITVIKGEVYDVRDSALRMDGFRGGVHTIDLSSYIDDIKRVQLAKAVLEPRDFALLECTPEVVAFASRNPSVLNFYASGGAHMKFRAWRTNLGFYWSMGAEIETWNSLFSTARIDSKYGVFGGSSNTCNVLHRDFDTDSTDDYMDEWEAGSLFSTVPDGHRSHCTAFWKGMTKSGDVSKGECGAWNG